MRYAQYTSLKTHHQNGCTKKFVRILHSIMQNEPNFPYFLPKNKDMTKKRTQYEPNRSQFWAIIKGLKPIRTQSKPNLERSASPELVPKVHSRRIFKNKGNELKRIQR